MTAELVGTELLDPDVIQDPYSFYRQLHAEAPVWRVPGTEIFVASTYATVADATARTDDFSSNMTCLLYRGEDGLPLRLSFGDGILQTLATADPPMHTLHRATVFPELVAKRMAALEPEVRLLADQRVDAALHTNSTEFMSDIGNLIPITMISRLIGFRDSDPQRLLRAAFDSTAMLGSTLTMERLHELIATSDDIGTWIVQQLEDTPTDGGDDILRAVARGVDAGALVIPEARVILHTLLSAGGESTTSLLGNAVGMLAEDLELQDQLRREPELIPAFVEEALRIESPFRYLMRSVPRDASLGGVDIPAGATVLLFWGAANRDAAEHPDADQIDLDRRVLRHHLAFGRGIHHCVGAPLARLEAQVVLRSLLERTDQFVLDPENPARWVDSLLVRRYERLPVILTAA